MKYIKTLLSLSIATTLTACGGSGGKSLTPPAEKKSTVCLDTNANAVCDAGETSEQVVTWDKENPVATTLTGAPLAYTGENGYIFTAPAGSPKIYAGTTMLNSEMIYNQVITNKTKADAKAYVHGKFGSEPSVEQKKDMADNFKKAIEANPAANRYAVIAAVMNKAMVTPNNIKNITVSAQDISAASVPALAKIDIAGSFSKNNDDEIQRQKDLGWVDAKDAELVSITAKNGKLVGGSHYHNGLTIIDVATKAKTNSPVSIITDSGDDIDSASGASETYIRDVMLSSDATYVYVNIPPKKSSSNTYDTEIMGLYKVKIEADGSIKTIETGIAGGGKRIAIDETESKRLNAIVSMFSVASDDSKVVLLDSEDNLSVYDGNLENELATVETEGFNSITIAGDSVFTTLEDGVSRLSTSNLIETAKVTLEFGPDMLVVSEDGAKLIAYAKGNLAVINLADNSVNASAISFNADSIALSANGNKLALSGEDETSIIILNLMVPGFPVQGKYDASSEAITFIGNDKLAMLDGAKKITILDVSVTTKNNNLVAKIKSAKEGLNENTINGGRLFNAVLEDVFLSDKHEDIAISWSSTVNASYLNIDNGTVTRPEIGMSDATGKLTAALSASFRGQDETDSKEINIIIPKHVPETEVTKSIPLSDDFEKHGGYMDTNSGGLLATLFTEERDDNEIGGIFILKSDGDDFDFYVGDTDISDGETYHKYDEKGDGIAVAFTKENQVTVVSTGGFIYRYTINAANDMTKSQKIAVEGQILSAGFNEAKTKLGILTLKDGNNITRIYDIDNNGTIMFNKNIAMQALDYDEKMTINNDASIVFAISGGEENIVNSQKGNIHTSHTSAVEFKGLTYLNNTLYVTDKAGIINAFTNGDLSQNKRTQALHQGRIYTLKEAAGKLFVFIYDKKSDGGISILNKNTFEELHFIPANSLRRGEVSPDGKSVYYFQRNKPKNLSYINLP